MSYSSLQKSAFLTQLINQKNLCVEKLMTCAATQTSSWDRSLTKFRVQLSGPFSFHLDWTLCFGIAPLRFLVCVAVMFKTQRMALVLIAPMVLAPHGGGGSADCARSGATRWWRSRWPCPKPCTTLLLEVHGKCRTQPYGDRSRTGQGDSGQESYRILRRSW